MKGVPDMKLVFAKSDLVNAINISLKAVPSKTTMPILECILIEASPSEIKLTSNDMELGIETLVKGDVLERGKIAIDAKLFSEIIRKLPDSDITIETDDRLNVSISCEKAHFNISGKSGDEFSYLPTIERNESPSLRKVVLRTKVAQLRGAAIRMKRA